MLDTLRSRGDDADTTRARLATLTGRTGLDARRMPVADDEPSRGPDPPATTAPTEPPRVRRDRVGRWIEHWIPVGLRTARWAPGRRSALVLCAALGVVAIVVGVALWTRRPVVEAAPALPSAASTPPRSSSPPPSTSDQSIVVSVVGEVNHPGLLTLREGARVADAVAAAGGVLPETDVSGLNLARRLADGEQVHVGVPPPPVPMADGGVIGPGTGASGGLGGGGKVNLNTAGAQQLDALPGVGLVTAQRIVDWRAKHGPFRTVEQLRQVEGIGETRFTRLRELVTL
ncbi:ComEA family DNA-binding protein [Streptoalloteichus hindustanus]|uniref:Competence protein ComEA n=1 Tax=Streptoalloteichus hindustanus TaxID=2017 RepID=A0A1M5BMJ7_STRHI|nr:ComEA family DNA-binding protein [Streptoalloteichus hindustanus]SHF43739.1 competence protein ComEA [Streptoalloteichus hindustanus]